MMKTIKENSVYKYEIKKSQFITLLYKITSVDDVLVFLTESKKLYQNATHYCFAYSVDGLEKFSDDGEPGGTAGLPIMEILHQHDLVNVLCIVIRYFGGIKLGAGRLVRSYRKAANEAVKMNVLVELVPGYLIELTSSYEEQKQLDYILKDTSFQKQYSDNVIYSIFLEQSQISILLPYSYKIINEIQIEKESTTIS